MRVRNGGIVALAVILSSSFTFYAPRTAYAQDQMYVISYLPSYYPMSITDTYGIRTPTNSHSLPYATESVPPLAQGYAIGDYNRIISNYQFTVNPVAMLNQQYAYMAAIYDIPRFTITTRTCIQEYEHKDSCFLYYIYNPHPPTVALPAVNHSVHIGTMWSYLDIQSVHYICIYQD